MTWCASELHPLLRPLAYMPPRQVYNPLILTDNWRESVPMTEYRGPHAIGATIRVKLPAQYAKQ